MAEENRIIGILALLKRVYLGKTVFSKILIAFLLSLILCLLFPHGESIELEYKIGAIWSQNDLIAPFSFPILRDDKEYQHDINKTRSSVYDVFVRDSAESERDLSQIAGFFRQVKEAVQLRELYLKEMRRNGADAGRDSIGFANVASRLSVPVSEKDWVILTQLIASGHLQVFEKSVSDAVGECLKTGILTSGWRTTSLP